MMPPKIWEHPQTSSLTYHFNMTRLYPPFLLLGFALLFAAGCASGDKDIRDYYFPLKALDEGLVYEYRAQGVEAPPVYWYYRSFLRDDGVFLTGTFYEQDLQPRQLIVEEFGATAVSLRDLTVYVPDSTGGFQPVQGRVESATVFPFKVVAGQTLAAYQVTLDFPNEDGYATTLIKNRRYLGDTTLVWEGQSYPAVRFALRHLMQHGNAADGYAMPEWQSTEIYAKGIGLLAYDQIYGDAGRVTYHLHRRYEMAELEEKFRAMESKDAAPTDTRPDTE